MYESLAEVTLKDGERVEAGVVVCPDAEWAERIEALLGHKGDVWRWQNRCCARDELGIDARYYLLHRDGVPFANMLTATFRGVGHFGHVFTTPEDRRKGAARQLMGLLIDEFRRRQGRALYLGTGFDSPPYHIYGSHGFVGLEPGSGQMDYYVDGSAEAFQADYLAAGTTRIAAPAWRHWPASAALFTSAGPEIVRCPGLGLLARASTEGPFLDVLRRQESRGASGTSDLVVAERVETGAVVALASCRSHPLWPGRQLLDLFGWSGLGVTNSEATADMSACLLELDDQLGDGCVSYSDGGEAREAALAGAGFQAGPQLPGWMASDRSGTLLKDVTIWVRS
ncbi:MAG: GNAT family N-acetyltransferase [Gemmatimonadetes bacterium]|jgi:GNAT superfamily N-acetyltransferase|nr:GNAT family N-acetyltransferase [Gemmatimonadota bacterium]MBT7862025.1 GNAT family N-acetyltransferase [Gemmatimonadota bacterium]